MENILGWYSFKIVQNVGNNQLKKYGQKRALESMLFRYIYKGHPIKNDSRLFLSTVNLHTRPKASTPFWLFTCTIFDVLHSAYFCCYATIEDKSNLPGKLSIGSYYGNILRCLVYFSSNTYIESFNMFIVNKEM